MSSWRYSESASSTPAMKVPSAIDKPTDSISTQMAITSSRANAVKISRKSVLAMKRRMGLTRKRPPITSAASTAASLATRSQPGSPLCVTRPPSSGTSAIMGMAAISWNSKMEKPAEPAGVLINFRSPRVASTMAVDDSDSPSAATSAVRQSTPKAMATAHSPALTTPTCAPPQPKMGRRNSHKRFGSSSRPIRNSSSTTPNSEKLRITSTFLIRPRPQGPMTTPATR